MANIKVTFKGNEYFIAEDKLASTYAALQLQMTALSDGTGGGSGGDEPDTPDEPVIPPVDENTVTVTLYAKYDKVDENGDTVMYDVIEPFDTITVEKGTTWREWIAANPDRGYHSGQAGDVNMSYITYGCYDIGHVYMSDKGESESDQSDLINAMYNADIDEIIGLRTYWNDETEEEVQSYDAVYVIWVKDNWAGKDTLIDIEIYNRQGEEEIVAQCDNVPYACTWEQLAAMYPDVISAQHEGVYYVPTNSQIYYEWGSEYPCPIGSDYILDHWIYIDM